MATHYIFIKDKKEVQEQIGGNACYVYDGEMLKIYNKGRLVFELKALEGEAFAILCEKGKVVLKNLIPPQRKGELVAWLMDYKKHNRAKSQEEYRKKLAKYRDRYDWYNYMEWEHRSWGYVFTVCNSPYSEKLRNVAAFITDAITRAEVIELIPFMTWCPDWYTQKILFECFKITREEFEAAQIRPL